jgi:hypothetical protein
MRAGLWLLILVCRDVLWLIYSLQQALFLLAPLPPPIPRVVLLSVLLAVPQVLYLQQRLIPPRQANLRLQVLGPTRARLISLHPPPQAVVTYRLAP